jgi:hypothetical protein
MARKESSPSPPSWVPRAELLLELSRLDTAYADLYRQRARQLASDELSPMDFRALKNAEQMVESLPSDIQRAMDDGKWDQVRTLTEQLGTKQRDLAERGALKKLGERLYEEEEIQVDPFSPGFYWYHRREERQLPALRDEALARLEQASRIDPEWKPFYQERREGLKAVQLAEPSKRQSGSVGQAELEQRAREALSQGNLDELKKLAGSLSQAGSGGPGGAVRDEATEDVEPPPLSFKFSSETLERARQLGLEPEHFDNMRARFRGLFRHLWHPVFFESEGNLPGARVSAALPKDTPDAQRERIVMFVTRPVLSSGGARFLPPLVDEDLLIESFDEGPAGSEVGKNGLAERLGLARRWALDRMAIERILQEKGPEVVKSLGLDPWKFRLVCVPPDIFGGVGARRGWGKQEIWTHLDGYLATRQRKLLALAGGDVRYGGVYDLVGIGLQYDSDRLLARFAIVDRRRTRAW